jgi:hypothetical protein
MTESLRVTEVVTRRDFRRFLEVPHLVYRGDPHWVAPLWSEVRKVLDRRRNPFFDHGEARYWLACRGDMPVGRISAQINRLHLETHHDATGNFGFLEAVDDPAVFGTLLGTAETWLKKQGMSRVLGPYSPTINDEIGVLVSGFGTPPTIGMAYSPRYYAQRLEDAGYRKVKDVHALQFDMAGARNRAITDLERSASRLNPAGRARVRPIEMGRFKEEMRSAIAVYNDAWGSNWGFVPVTTREVEHLIAAIRPVLRPDYILLGEIDGRIEGVFLALPDLNEVIADLHGRLMPFGWAKLLWRLRMRPPKAARVILAGVRKAYQNSPLGAALLAWMLADIIKAGHRCGTEQVELSWVLEDNARSLTFCQRAGGRINKTYRIYQKRLE